MSERPVVTPSQRLVSEAYATPVKRASWSAIIAGVITIIMVEIVLALLGLTLGMHVVNPQSDRIPYETLDTNATIWWMASGAVALFMGGLVAGRLAGIPRRLDGAFHGLVTWAVANLLIIFLLTSTLNTLVSGALGALNTGLTFAGKTIVEAVPESVQKQGQNNDPGMVIEEIRREAHALILGIEPVPTTGTAEDLEERVEMSEEQEQSLEQLDNALRRLFAEGREAAGRTDRESVINILVAGSDLSRDQAEQRVENWIQRHEQQQEELGEDRESTATAMDPQAEAAMWGFIMLIVGALITLTAGAIGSPRELIVSRTR